MPTAKKQRPRTEEPSAAETPGRVRWELMEQKLFDVAERLFAERGFDGTTVQDVADAMGVSRPALYYYVKRKEDILTRLVERLAVRDSDWIREVRLRKDLTPAEKLHEIVYMHVLRLTESPGSLRLLDRNEHHLTGSAGKTYAEARRAVLAETASIIGDGVKEGQFRAVDPRTAALAILGMSNWVSWWFEPGPAHSGTAVAEEIADMAISAVAVHENDGQTSTPADVVRQIGYEVERLARMLADKDGDGAGAKPKRRTSANPAPRSRGRDSRPG